MFNLGDAKHLYSCNVSYIYSIRPFPKPFFLRKRIRTIIYWKTRAKFETGQLVTPLTCNPDTKPALLGSLLMKALEMVVFSMLGLKKYTQNS